MPKTVDGFVNEVVGATIGLVILGAIFGEQAEPKKPKHKPKGKWRNIRCLKDAY